MKRMLLKFAGMADGNRALVGFRTSEDGPGWNMTLNALLERNLITFVPDSPAGNAGKFIISEEGTDEASRIRAVNARKAGTA